MTSWSGLCSSARLVWKVLALSLLLLDAMAFFPGSGASYDIFTDAPCQLRELVTATVEVADLQQARRLATLIPTGEEQFQAYWVLALAYAKLGLVVEARDLARSISNQRRRDSILRDVARAQAEAKDVNGALRTVELIQGRATKEDAIELIAITQAKGGDGRGGLRTAKRIHGRLNRQSLVYRMAYAQAETGDAQHACVWAGGLTNSQERTSAFLGVVDGGATCCSTY